MNAPLIESTKLSATALAMIRQLVSFNTTSRESNLALIEWVSGYLRDHGIESRLTFDDAGKKANLFATIGPQLDGGIPLILCGPGHIAQAHQPNEWVDMEQVARCEAFLRRLIDQAGSPRA